MMFDKSNIPGDILRLLVVSFVFISLFRSPDLYTFLWAFLVLYGALTPLRLHLELKNKKEDS